MKQILLVIGLMTLILTGCGTPSPYLEVGVGYNLDKATDYWLRTERSWTCDNHDVFHAEAGVEFDSGWRVGYHHQSHISCGGPFNNDPEVYQDEIIVTKKFGGKQ